MALPPQLHGLERVRVIAAYVFLVLIVLLVLSSLTELTPGVDLGVFGTLVGAELALVSAGAIIKFVGK